MKRVFAITALFALALPSLAAAQHPEHRGPVRPAVRGPVIVHPNVRVVPRVVGPRVVGPRVVGPRVVIGGHGPFMFHGRSFAWHPVHFGRPWVYPPGYGYRLWAVGAVLPPLFWSTPTYYYPGYASLGLPPPDPGFQYVQYGPDLILVNVATGEVLQVFPGAFT
jgi:Ni/Co efflux regulator RcnB